MARHQYVKPLDVHLCLSFLKASGMKWSDIARATGRAVSTISNLAYRKSQEPRSDLADGIRKLYAERRNELEAMIAKIEGGDEA